MYADPLSRTFSALADPTRRAILAQLTLGEASVTELAEPFDMSLPAITKHLKVLERAGLIARGRTAQWRPCRLDAAPLKGAADWLEGYRIFWEQSLDRLEGYLAELQGRSVPLEKATSVGDGELIITRIIDAPRELVFETWTRPEHIARWWGPRGFTTIACEMDVRVGGAYRFGMRAPDGAEHWKRGVYREIVTPERIVFTFAWEGANGNPGHELLTTVSFLAEGTKTRLILHQAKFTTAQWRDEHIAGWTSCLERFADYILTLRLGE